MSIISVALAVLPALLLALMRLSKNKVVRSIAGGYIAVFRSTPLLVQLSLIYFGLLAQSRFLSFTFLALLTPRGSSPGVVALALNSAAYVAEIFRAGIPSGGLWTNGGAPAPWDGLMAVYALGGAAPGR